MVKETSTKKMEIGEDNIEVVESFTDLGSNFAADGSEELEIIGV